MDDEEFPQEIRALASERDERRRAKDFGAADELRDRLLSAGYRVVDGPDGTILEWLEPGGRDGLEARRVRPDEVASILEAPPTMDFSVHWLVQGWPQDVVRGIRSFRRHCGHRSVQHVVVDAGDTDPAVWPDGIDLVPLVRDFGWAADRNCGLRRAAGRIVVVIDGSVEATGDALGPLESELADPSVGVAGPFGIVTEDLREFAESDGPEVDTIEGYLMAFRREVLLAAGLFDERFKFYRTADIECSFRIKERGLRAVVVPVPVRRHEHRAWNHTPQTDRDRLSKRNYYRFLDRFRGRFDLTVSGGSAPHRH